VAVVVLVAGTWLPGTTLALAVIVAGVALAVGSLVRRRRRARAADRRAEEVLAVCEALASDLAAGQPPVVCLTRAAAEWPELGPAAAAGEMGADVPAALRLLARRPGAVQLRNLAASWQVAHETGSGLAAAVNRAAQGIRAQRRTARLVSAELASARATARMLAVLPVGVLLLGAGVGGDPVGLLLTTPFGLGCLAVGSALSLAGLAWLEHIADRVLRR
jgi:tight adherence protein B